MAWCRIQPALPGGSTPFIGTKKTLPARFVLPILKFFTHFTLNIGTIFCFIHFLFLSTNNDAWWCNARLRVIFFFIYRCVILFLFNAMDHSRDKKNKIKKIKRFCLFVTLIMATWSEKNIFDFWFPCCVLLFFLNATIIHATVNKKSNNNRSTFIL